MASSLSTKPALSFSFFFLFLHFHFFTSLSSTSLHSRNSTTTLLLHYSHNAMPSMTTSLWNCITLNSNSKLEAVRMHSLISSPRTSTDFLLFHLDLYHRQERRREVIIVVDQANYSSLFETSSRIFRYHLSTSKLHLVRVTVHYTRPHPFAPRPTTLDGQS